MMRKRQWNLPLTSNYRPAYALLSLLFIVGCLIAYKTTASLAVIEKVQATGVLKPRFELMQTDSSPVWAGALMKTLCVIVPYLLSLIVRRGAGPPAGKSLFAVLTLEAVGVLFLSIGGWYESHLVFHYRVGSDKAEAE